MALLSPKQVGFGVRGGCEGAVHAARRYIAHLAPGQVILKLDFKNAFNSIRRDSILEAISLHTPSIFRFVEATYGAHSMLRFGDFTISSSEGVQQGDPLGPLLFCLTLHSTLSTLKSEFALGYLDDVTLGGDHEAVLEDFLCLKSAASDIGLSLNQSKCEVIGHTAASRSVWVEQGVTIPETAHDKAILLGAPISPGTIVDDILEIKRMDLKTLSERLPLMPRHDSLFLLSNIVAMPRLLYTLRTAPCMSSIELSRYDELLRSTLAECMNVDLSQSAWEQASLPVRFGGLGVRSAVLLAPSAYLASAAGAESLMQSILPPRLHSVADPDFSSALAHWQSQVDPTTIPPVASLRIIQKNWDNPCCSLVFSSLLTKAVDVSAKARLLGSADVNSGIWLKAIPLTAVGLKLDDEAVRIAVGLRLGGNVCEVHTCPCGAAVDSRGTHGLACKFSAGRHSRHSQLNDLVQRSLSRAQIPARKEPTGLCRSDGKRPDGVTLIPWSRGRCMTWDVTVVDTLAPSHVSTSASKAGSAAGLAEQRKMLKYSSIAQSHTFIPLAFETIGAWGTQCENFVKDLGRRLVLATGDKLEPLHLRQRLALAIQRGNAIACLGTLDGQGKIKEGLLGDA